MDLVEFPQHAQGVLHDHAVQHLFALSRSPQVPPAPVFYSSYSSVNTTAELLLPTRLLGDTLRLPWARSANRRPHGRSMGAGGACMARQRTINVIDININEHSSARSVFVPPPSLRRWQQQQISGNESNLCSNRWQQRWWWWKWLGHRGNNIPATPTVRTVGSFIALFVVVRPTCR